MRLKKSGNKFCLDKISQEEMECIWMALHQTFMNDFDPDSVFPTDDGMVEVPAGVGVYMILSEELNKFGFLSELEDEMFNQK